MTDIYDPRSLDRLLDREDEWREAESHRATLDWLDNYHADQADRNLNEMCSGHVDDRGRALAGFEPIRVAASDGDLRAVIERRKRIEFAADPAMTRRVLLEGVTR